MRLFNGFIDLYIPPAWGLWEDDVQPWRLEHDALFSPFTVLIDTHSRDTNMATFLTVYMVLRIVNCFFLLSL